MLSVAVSSIRQKERIKVNLKNVLVYFKRYSHRDFVKIELQLLH